MNITILVSDPLHPVVPKLKEWQVKLTTAGHSISLINDREDLSEGDVLFLVSCNQMVNESHREKYRVCLVLHASDLPKGRGWSPYIWAVLNGESEITVCLLGATEPVDSGDIWLRQSFTLEGHELLPEINAKLFETELALMSKAVEQFELIHPQSQSGDSDYMQKRSPDDSRLDPEKSIADQFDLLRVVDSERFPAFFEYRGKKYHIKIEKSV
jgi:methionyl-tRNA formyltransferase